MPYDRKLIDYVPPYYTELLESSELLRVEDREFSKLYASIDDLLLQYRVSTATWGLREWERILAMPPTPNSSIETRRARILARLRGTAPATLANMLAIINAHVPSQGNEIIELPEPGVVEFVINANKPYNYSALASDIAMYIPAHLSYRVATASRSHAYIAACPQVGVEITVYPYRPVLKLQQASANNGGIMHHAHTVSIYPKGDE